LGRAGQEAPEFGGCRRNPRDLAKNRIAVEPDNFENFSEKVNQFNTVSGGLATIEAIQANNQSRTPHKIE
jgi:hypothetical protein